LGEFSASAQAARLVERTFHVLKELLHSAASRFDRAVAATVDARTKRSRAAADILGHHDRMTLLERVRAEYAHDPPSEADGVFFPPVPKVTPQWQRVRELTSRRGRVVVSDATWPSLFTPRCKAIASRYLAYETNRSAAARMFLHEGAGPRPAVIIVHGYLCGQYGFEERVWPISWLLDHGLEVALAVLPFHAVRAERGVLFPSHDPRITNEGFLQAMLDVRTLASLFRERGAPEVGVMGMSLGGYTTSLLATIDPTLAFAIPLIPLASLADFVRDNGRLVGTLGQQRLEHAAIDAAYSVVSPLARPLKVDRSRVLVVGAAGDGITPIAHAERLAQHFDVPLHTFNGGHLLQVWRPRAFRAVGRLLGGLGLFDR
jgi:pimeloyl-ACP methyl ester carboxylesterase